jgi:hypothetical protein
VRIPVLHSLLASAGQTSEAAAAAKLRRRTAVLGIAAAASVGALFATEFARVWRLGKLPLEHGDLADANRNASRSASRVIQESRRSASQVRRIVREGFAVSSARKNAMLTMEVAFVTTFAVTRYITYTIRVRGQLGPIKNVRVGSKHIHHFVPGTLLSLAAGGASIASPNEQLDRWLAIPFGVGTALVLDESALLLELQDVYWSEEGIVSLQIAFAAVTAIAALAYGVRVVARGETRVLESDWEIAAKAWEDLQSLPRS